MNKSTNTGILLLGSTGFPFGSATIQRQIQLAKSLINAGFDVCVINNCSSHSKLISKRENIKILGNHDGIRYFYSSFLPYKSTNLFIRNFFKLLGRFIEVLAILYLRVFKNYKHILLRTHKLKSVKFYSKISKIFSIELIYDYVEFYDSLGNRNQSVTKNVKINSFDFNFIKYIDKVIVISGFLEKHVKSLDTEISMIKVPPIIDFDYFDKIKVNEKSDLFFLFCGSAAYEDLMEFIINSYIKSNAKETQFKLKLVINGDERQLNQLDNFIKDKNYEKNIIVLSQLPYLDLIKLYKSASALLIPIGNNLQDDARFPFKICEYTASKRPIITSESGAILEFFEDDLNAIIAKTEDVDDFALKMNKIIKQPSKADRIGENGYDLGRKVFNYSSYSKDLSKLILS